MSESYNPEKFKHQVIVAPESMFAMYRAGNRIMDSSDASLFKRGYSTLKSLLNIYADGRNVVANQRGDFIAEAIVSPVFEAARNRKPDSAWISRAAKVNIQGEVFAYDDEVDEFIREVKDMTGIESEEILTAHAFTVLDWVTYKVDSRQAIGALDINKGKVGIVTLGFMDYKIPPEEVQEALSSIIDIVPISLYDPYFSSNSL